jgi:ankyrin repeat protein
VCVVQDGATPLHWADSNGHTEIVEMLLAAGADVTITPETPTDEDEDSDES